MASLAARCTACGTVFRVVPDQLRVAGGLVRCGRCSEVFNAAESLVDLESGAPARDVPTARQSAEQQAPAVEAGTDFELDLQQDDPAEPEPTPDEIASADYLAEAAASKHEEDANPDLFEDLTPEEPGPDPTPEIRADDEAAIVDIDFAATRQDEIEELAPQLSAMDRTPSFVRSADRAQRWRSPRMRAGLAGAATLGVLLLMLQLAHTYRDLVVARFPATRVAMESVCTLLACRIEAARSIDSLAVESSGLVRVEKSSVYKLQVALRNRAAIQVAMPAVDLTLSDAQGKPIARRVLRAAELGVNEATLAAGRELNLQATLQAATEPVAGYTIELFYP